ncbi:restriction endonuclease subunit S [Streptococcus parasanguinis]|jgi:type I restriction-modification system specificity subunit|uniref:restriction endonuclease subunit S n=1 Tax=Streptococcus parasanguinis TaxID=1318 RepID=UPI00066BACFB|nr:restriction endonuclease subunit S [Streptococcus parasanguinis]MBS7076702.1 restriction endonuclease subunit S [Streptococcus parasanguinis]MDO6230567.1 restriction endonuclease subunit S [Streptococcus parasanguinis]
MKKQINVPSIIFSRFNEDSSWKSKKFKELLDPTEGIRRGPFGSALKKELFVQNSEYVVYEQQNAIYDHFNTRYRISEEKYHELKKFILLPGDFIMSGAGTIGKISLVPEGIEKGVFNQALIRLRVNKNTDKEFFLQWMRSPEMQNKLTKANPASAMVNLVPMSEVKEWDVIIPSLDEQSAIGSLFRTLDDLLASYKDNLANYQSLKVTMLSKMFPKAGQTVPEIRLDGFEGEWEEKKLGSLGSVAMNKRIFKDETSDYGDIPFYKIGTFGGTADSFITKEKFKEYKEKYPYPEIGDILISASGSIGRTVVYNGEDAYYQDSNIVWLKHDQQLDNSYLKQYYGIIKWSGIEGTTIKRLYNKNILETNIFLPPSVVEQQAIGAYFSNLDNLITSYQEKISQLETLKKKLLQDMFI